MSIAFQAVSLNLRNPPDESQFPILLGYDADKFLDSRRYHPGLAGWIAASGFLCMADSTLMEDTKSAQVIFERSAQIFSLIGCADAFIDNDLSIRENNRGQLLPEAAGTFLSNLLLTLQTNQIGVASYGWESAAFAVARRLGDALRGDGVDPASLFHQLNDIRVRVVDHLKTTDPNELLTASKGIGGAVCELTPIVMEIYLGRNLDHLRRTSQHFGAYGQIIDDFHDVGRDLRHKVHTYPTQMIKIHGDNRRARRDIRMTMLGAARDEWCNALDSLTGDAEAQKILKEMKCLFDLKYKIQAVGSKIERAVNGIASLARRGANASVANSDI